MAQLRLLIPELQKLIGGDELGSGEIRVAQVLHGLTLNKSEPTHKVADAVAVHGAPVSLGGSGAMLRFSLVLDAVGALAGGDQLPFRNA